jgi:hypothetical protein
MFRTFQQAAQMEVCRLCPAATFGKNMLQITNDISCSAINFLLAEVKMNKFPDGRR